MLDGLAETRRAYCLHALNHVLKANSRVLTHNAVLKEAKGGVEDEFRDQGLTRPKVSIRCFISKLQEIKAKLPPVS